MHKKIRLKHYAAGLAGVTSIAPSSHASVVYWNPTDVTLSVDERVSFDMLTGVVTLGSNASTRSGFTAINYTNYNPNYAYIRNNAFNNGGLLSDDYAFLLRLNAGDVIGPAQSFPVAGGQTAYFDNTNGGELQWNTNTNGTTGFVGLRFYDGGLYHYGWARFTYNDISNTLVLQDFAYESDPGTAIVAGATSSVPEPSSLLLLASGGVLAARRRRRAA